MTNSDHSLSVVLPVFNVQNSLAHLIHQMLDILPDVTPEFEILVVDDGSTDHTEEVARELAVRYPQVRVARHADRLGGEAVIETGYAHSRGRVVIVQQENTALGQAELKRVCQMHAQEPEPALEPDLVELDAATEEYLAAWSAAFRKKMKRPTRAELEEMVADLPEAEDDAMERTDASHLRTDPPFGDRADLSPFFGPPQPRFRPSRR